MHDALEKTYKKLVVSCQALEHEPLHGSDTMAKMARAAMLGGAGGIRANSVSDIRAIKQVVDLPIIGIIKSVYPGSEVFITPTMDEVDALVACGVDIIATDCTERVRPDGVIPADFFRALRRRHPHQLFMADCSTAREARMAQEFQFDIVSTTLCGYTEYTKGLALPSFPLIEEISATVSLPLYVEGGIWEAATFARVHAMPGVHAVVIGTAITRPLEITRHFLSAVT